MIWIYTLLNALILLVGIRYVRHTGAQYVIPFAVCLGLLVVYCLLTPFYYYLTGRETVTGDLGMFRFVGKNIRAYFEPGMLAYMIANGCFVLGFISRQLPELNRTSSLPADTLASLRQYVVGLYGLFMGIVLADVIISGVNPLAVLLGSSDQSLFASQSASNTYYFRAFADSIITTIVLYAYLRGNFSKLVMLLVPAFVLFALLGFRYRLILTILGLVLVYLLQGGLTIHLKRWTVAGLLIFYFVSTITHNRWYFISGQYDDMTLDPTRYDYAMFFEQTRGSLADFNLLRYYDENPETCHDYGASMFGYVLVRVVPRQLFPGGEKPYPSPYLDVLDRSLELPRDWLRIGEATLHYGAFYAGFGWLGFWLLPFGMGLWLNAFVRRNPAANPLGFCKQIVFSLALFQFITRGYFPQFVDHYVYLFIPLWLIGRRMRQVTVPTVLPVHHEAVC